MVTNDMKCYMMEFMNDSERTVMPMYCATDEDALRIISHVDNVLSIAEWADFKLPRVIYEAPKALMSVDRSSTKEK